MQSKLNRFRELQRQQQQRWDRMAELEEDINDPSTPVNKRLRLQEKYDKIESRFMNDEPEELELARHARSIKIKPMVVGNDYV